MTEKNNEQKLKLEQGLEALKTDLLVILKNNKQVIIEKTNTFILKAYEHFLKYGDSDIFKRLFFVRVGNTTLFNKLSLRAFFEYNDIIFVYNVKKDSLKLAYTDPEKKGKPLNTSYTEYRAMPKESLTPEQKEQRLFEKVASLTDEQKARLKAYLKN